MGKDEVVWVRVKVGDRAWAGEEDGFGWKIAMVIDRWRQKP